MYAMILDSSEDSSRKLDYPLKDDGPFHDYHFLSIYSKDDRQILISEIMLRLGRF